MSLATLNAKIVALKPRDARARSICEPRPQEARSSGIASTGTHVPEPINVTRDPKLPSWSESRRVPKAVIANIVLATDIVALVNDYLPLERDGSRYKALCPFHDEKTPSFKVNPEKQKFHCFGCGFGGNAIDFVIRRESVPFLEAIKKLAQRAGIHLSLLGADSCQPTASKPQPHRKNNIHKEEPHGVSAQQPVFDWSASVLAFSDEKVKWLANWRGYSEEFCRWLVSERLIGWVTPYCGGESYMGFPVFDENYAHVIGAHYRVPDKGWRYTTGAKPTALTVGTIKGDAIRWGFESPWDMLAILDASDITNDTSWRERVCAVATRGMTNGALLGDFALPGQPFLLFPQNDPVDEKGHCPSEVWFKKASESIGEKRALVQRVNIPVAYKDANDWVRAGATAEQVNEAIQTTSATSPVTVDAYYDSTRKEFMMMNSSGRWLSHPSKQFQMLMRDSGIAPSIPQAERIMAKIIDTRDVAYTGGLAGRRAGFYEANGIRMLITEGPRVLTPKPGRWPAIGTLIEGLLGSDKEHGELQVSTLCLWLKSGHQSVSSGRWRPGHILALAGPVACGKSLLQRLITECLGSRAANAITTAMAKAVTA